MLYPYYDIHPTPHLFDDAITALQELGIRVIGISSSAEGEGELREVATLTGAVDGDGVPLVHTISPSGTGLDEEVVRGIESLALRVPLDVDAIAIDVPGDDLDATILIHEIIAVRADPPGGVDRIEDATFYDAMPGTTLYFALDIRVDVIPVPLTTQVYPVTIRIRGNRISILREVTLRIVVPGLDGALGC